jgi:hypothetical protein
MIRTDWSAAAARYKGAHLCAVGRGMRPPGRDDKSRHAERTWAPPVGARHVTAARRAWGRRPAAGGRRSALDTARGEPAERLTELISHAAAAGQTTCSPRLIQ